MAEYDGPGAYENAHPELEELVHEFFQEGYEYSNQDGYRAPEIVNTFRCGWTGVHPETGEKIAFGFMHNTFLGWAGTGMGPIHWDWGWSCSGRWPLDGGGGGAK